MSGTKLGKFVLITTLPNQSQRDKELSIAQIRSHAAKVSHEHRAKLEGRSVNPKVSHASLHAPKKLFISSLSSIMHQLRTAEDLLAVNKRLGSRTRKVFLHRFSPKKNRRI